MDRKNRHNIDVVFVLGLFAVFAVSVLMVLMLGVSSYNDIADRMEDNYENRTAVAYIAAKARQNGGGDGVYIGQYSGQQALVFEENIDGEDYATYIYHYDGQLREIFTFKDNFLEPQAGEVIVAAEGLSLEMASENLIKVTVEMNDESRPYVLLSTDAGADAGDGVVGGYASSGGDGAADTKGGDAHE
ncbi:MAG: DUF4860 domain-containing protein [Firmicutes bacterium]|nr:DUF4860 domain-containing protein [Bacillota bacterium]